MVLSSTPRSIYQVIKSVYLQMLMFHLVVPSKMGMFPVKHVQQFVYSFFFLIGILIYGLFINVECTLIKRHLSEYIEEHIVQY